MPPGRMVMLEKSASPPGLSIRFAIVRVSVVSDETPICTVGAVLPPVAATLGVLDMTVAFEVERTGAMYPSGKGTQLLLLRNVPCRRSHNSALKSGRSTPS